MLHKGIRINVGVKTGRRWPPPLGAGDVLASIDRLESCRGPVARERTFGTITWVSRLKRSGLCADKQRLPGLDLASERKEWKFTSARWQPWGRLVHFAFPL